jgi:hypothetical protein
MPDRAACWPIVRRYCHPGGACGERIAVGGRVCRVACDWPGSGQMPTGEGYVVRRRHPGQQGAGFAAHFDPRARRPVSLLGVHVYRHARAPASAGGVLAAGTADSAPGSHVLSARARIQDSHAKAYDCAHI